MKLIKKILEPLVKIWFKMVAKTKLKKLANHPSLEFRKIVLAILDTINENLSKEEKERVEKIESLRKNIYKSQDQVRLVDYGAGLDREGLSKEEMEKGTTIKDRLGHVALTCSKSSFWSLLLFKIIRKNKPVSSLEFGTCVGISGAYQASALKLNGGGKIITMEGDSFLARVAKGTFNVFALENIDILEGRFADTLSKLLVEKDQFDYVFIDGHHDEQATVDYFDRIYPHLTQNAVVVFDDISWSSGMRRAWNTIISDDRIRVSLYLRQIGICLIDKNIPEKLNYRIPLLG